jgi:two-component system phosphate regulon sensor histidine kinase PhoR
MSLAIENALLYGRALLERNKVEAVVKSMGDGVMTLDWDRRITSFNQAAEEITGWDAGEALGKHCYDIAWSVDREGDRMCDKDCPFLKVTGSGESFERGLKSESLMYSKDGTPKYVSATHSVLNLGGDQAGGVMVFRDITEFKQAEQMRQDYLATISHDLKTPLTAIKGYALTLLRHGERFDYDTQREFLKVINAELDRLNRLLDNLMNLTRMEAGKLTARPQPFKLGPVMRRVSELHQVNTKDHSFVLDVRADLPLVYADQDQVEQILNNLVSNAIKYSPSGGEITLRAWAEGDQVVACVSDSGQGIARDEIPKLFKRYHRIQNRVTRKVSGTGLGLFITKTLVEAQGGSVWVESAPGKGSSFYFSLPTAQSGEKGNPEAL